MRQITFFSKDGNENGLSVLDSPSHADCITLEIEGRSVDLNAVQVDKLRQVFHGWLHERANGEDGANWTEEALRPVPYPVRI